MGVNTMMNEFIDLFQELNPDMAVREADRKRLLEEQKRLKEKEREEKTREYNRNYNRKRKDDLKRYYVNNIKNNPEALERKRRRQREYRKENYAKLKEQNSAWQKENKHLVKAKLSRRKARLNRLPATLSKEDTNRLLQQQENKCWITGDSNNLELEHFIPISWGVGGTTFKNCYFMNGSLNKSKNNSNPFEWIKTQPEEYQSNFYNKLIPELASRNNMTVGEFKRYVEELAN